MTRKNCKQIYEWNFRNSLYQGIKVINYLKY